MQHPPPRGRRSFWQWYRAQARFARIGLGCASIFVALLLCTVALTVYGSTLPPTRTPALTQAPTHAVVLTTPRPTATPTTTPTRTPTPTPSKVTVPHLGGAITDFIAKYGQPVDHSDPYTYGWFRGNNGDSLRVSTLIDPHHVDEIDVQAVNGNMSNTPRAAQHAVGGYSACVRGREHQAQVNYVKQHHKQEQEKVFVDDDDTDMPNQRFHCTSK